MQLADPIQKPADDTPGTPALPDTGAAPPILGEPSSSGLRFPIHVNARGMALGTIATIAFVFALQWSQDFLVPLLLGILLAYTLNPLVLWLERIKVPRPIGATLVTVAMLCAMVGIGHRVQDEFFNIVDELPQLTKKLTKVLRNTNDGTPSTIAQVQAAAAQIEQAANSGGDDRRSAQRKLPPQVDGNSSFKIMDWVLAGSMSLLGFISQATMVVFLVFFLLLAGDTFKRKLVKLTGPSLSRKKVTVQILDDINTSIQNYMFMLLVTNALLALDVGGAARHRARERGRLGHRGRAAAHHAVLRSAVDHGGHRRGCLHAI
jgi:predicted PurR-regulated permease PerM